MPLVKKYKDPPILQSILWNCKTLNKNCCWCFEQFSANVAYWRLGLPQMLDHPTQKNSIVGRKINFDQVTSSWKNFNRSELSDKEIFIELLIVRIIDWTDKLEAFNNGEKF